MMLSVLIIGCGNIAGGFDIASKPGSLPRTHAGAYAEHGQFSMQACIEPDDHRRAAFMARWNIAAGYASFEQLVAANGMASHAEPFDIVSICSPTSCHHHDVEQALGLSPKLIFCEKPVTGNLQQSQHAVQLCSDQGVQLAVNHNRRWDPDVARLREQLKVGYWGSIRSVTGQYNKGVLNNGSHMVDLLQNLLGPLTLRDCGLPSFDYLSTDPSIPASLVSSNGVPVTLSCGNAGDFSLFELQLVTQRGVIAMEDGGLHWRTRLSAPSLQFSGYQALAEGQVVGGRYFASMPNAVANIYQAVTTGEALASTGDSALEAQFLCQAMLARSLELSAATSVPGEMLAPQKR